MKKSKTQRKDLISSIDTKSYFDLPTLPTLQRLKSSISQPWILSSTRSIRAFHNPHLAKLRTRKKVSKDLTPSLVQKVVKKYFIPIFEAQRHRQKNLKTSRTTEFSQSLSESLLDELKKHRNTLNELNLKLNSIYQDKEQKLKEISEYKEKILNLEGVVKAYGACTGMLFDAKENDKALVKRLDGKYLKINDDSRELKYLLSHERYRNLKLKDNALVLEHWNSLYNMQSDIMGEQLKGLYFSLNQLSLDYLFNTFKVQKSLCTKSCQNICKIELSLSRKIYRNIKSLNSTVEVSFLTLETRKSLLKELKDRSLAFKYDQEWHQSEIKKHFEEKELYHIRLFELEKKNTVLEEDYEKTRTIILDIKKKSKFNDIEEKVCKFCKKVFIEKENFNWSCRNHLSEWGENHNYWCCGAEDKEAPGCKMSKHVSDEVGENKFVEKLDKKTKKKTVCRTCKNIGHVSTECPVDPNIRTRVEMRKEHLRKKRGKVSYLGVAKLKNEEISESDEFDDIELAKKEAVIESFDGINLK